MRADKRMDRGDWIAADDPAVVLTVVGLFDSYR